LLQLSLRPSAVYLGKLLFNVGLTLALCAAAALLFLLLLHPPLRAPGLFALTLTLGAVGLAGATTLLSAIIARTASSGPLFAVVRLTRLAFESGAAWAEGQADLLSLLGYGGLTITASLLLFDYAWRD